MSIENCEYVEYASNTFHISEPLWTCKITKILEKLFILSSAAQNMQVYIGVKNGVIFM